MGGGGSFPRDTGHHPWGSATDPAMTSVHLPTPSLHFFPSIPGDSTCSVFSLLPFLMALSLKVLLFLLLLGKTSSIYKSADKSVMRPIRCLVRPRVPAPTSRLCPDPRPPCSEVSCATNPCHRVGACTSKDPLGEPYVTATPRPPHISSNSSRAPGTWSLSRLPVAQ